jgi:mono/diheme cytochrome c family protein
MRSKNNVLGQRLRPERVDGVEPAAGRPTSESERGWDPASRKRSWRKATSQLVAAIICFAGVTACRQDMHNQPKYRALRATTFFANGSSARPLVEGTIARGTLQEDEAFFTGKVGNALVRELPFPIDDRVLSRGQDRFNVFCTPCHDATGSGHGMVVQRGYRQPPSFHDERLRNADAGHFFDVMTNGFGAMPDYKMQLPARDRWAVVAYIRALQLSQHAAAADIPGGDPTKVQPAGAPERGPVKH